MEAKVIIAEPLTAESTAWLAKQCQVIEAAPGTPAFEAHAGQIQGLVIRTSTRIDRQILEHMPRLKVIARAGVGLDHIDLAACKAQGIRVVYTPDANTQAVVEYVLTLVLDAIRPRIFLTSAVDQSRWEKLRGECTAARQLNEMTVGILGLGRIGKRLACALNALGCKVLFHDLLDIDRSARCGADTVPVHELFARSDIVSLHIDGREGNRGFVDADLIQRMQDHVLFVNTSRGHVVDHDSLAKFLADHPRARALLDVHDPEPFPPSTPLLGLANARLSPHLASRTRTAVHNMSWVVRDLFAVLQGKTPQHEA